jgi:hypothetical protein
MTYEAKERKVGASLLTQEQKIAPMNGHAKLEQVDCCCSNGHRPYLLNGQWVVSTSPACRLHYNYIQENQLIESKMGEELR